jgi:uncharacterized membrane protein
MGRMNSSSTLLLAAHLAATAAMTGLIWFVQVVHYPLFRGVGEERSVSYAVEHQRRTSYVVGPFMAVEGVTALWIAADPPGALGRAWPIVGLVLLAIIHASTVWLQVPQHAALAEGYDERRVARLVATNWVRTAGWTARALLAVVMVVVVAAA